MRWHSGVDIEHGQSKQTLDDIKSCASGVTAISTRVHRNLEIYIRQVKHI